MKITNRKSLAPALLMAVLALSFLMAGFLATPLSQAQKTKDLGPPPPVPRYKPKPTPTPAPTPEPEYEVVRITSNLVMVPVSVTDAQGNPVLGLKQTDFRIDEDGRTQEITQIGDPEHVPLDIALLIDVSASVVARFDFEQQAAATFLKQVLKSEDRATVFAIDKSPRMVQQLATAAVASQSLMTVKSSNSFTAFFDSVLAAAKYLDQSSPTGRRRIVVVISDGDDTARVLDAAPPQPRDGDGRRSGADIEGQLAERGVVETQHEVQRAEITFYSINPTGQSLRLNPRATRAEQGMERIAAATGGNAFVPKDESELVGIFNRIASEIRSQYLLQYYSNNEAANRTFRRIAVSTPQRAELRVRAREGYYPKAK
ncbi:MAG TPA: VWA domain-containing protein [Pyrinomonadaceae bacterium]|nr:VWA domain-containing protein [Pyrinomonadaceae bacterium]